MKPAGEKFLACCCGVILAHGDWYLLQGGWRRSWARKISLADEAQE
jgi:hypothetical protein